MYFFEYPYVIITIFVLCLLFMGAVGIYFTIKSARAINGAEKKGFCNISRIESDFIKLGRMRKERCLIFVSLSLDSMSRLYSDSKAARILKQIGNILLRYFCIDFGGNISLYGDDDFVAIVEASPENIELCFDKCYEEINKVLVDFESVNIAHVNFGYFCTSSTEVSFKTAFNRAKQACTMAEENEEEYFRWNMNSGKKFEKKIEIENSIEGEIEKNRFFLVYQPIIDAKTNKIIGAEVLSRLNSSSEGILTPRSFLSAVSNVGINDKFDYYIFEKNCKWISNDKENRSKIFFTINFSRATFCDESFAENIIAIIEKCGCGFSSVALEILEDKDLSKEEMQIMGRNLKLLKEKGVLILLDDFGKGYTSFSDLAQLGIDIVKIDKAITQKAMEETGFVILKNIIRTAHDLGLKTLCEGIETEEQKKIVLEAGCDILQGYYFYRPMPVVDLEKLFNG